MAAEKKGGLTFRSKPMQLIYEALPLLAKATPGKDGFATVRIPGLQGIPAFRDNTHAATLDRVWWNLVWKLNKAKDSEDKGLAKEAGKAYRQCKAIGYMPIVTQGAKKLAYFEVQETYLAELKKVK